MASFQGGAVGYSLGVDLGTTFVAAAIASTSRIEMVTLGDRSVVTPATVYLREDGTLVTGEAAGLRVVSSPDRVSREFKRRLGNPTPVVLGGQSFPVTALLGTLLRDVVQKVIETEGASPDRLLLTHPANWGPFRRALFEEVPQYAGLESPPMVTEPEAAAAHYAASRLLDDGQTVAVYDLGGGTFDATILRKLPTGVEILGTPEGIERLGGVDFDEAILSYVDYEIGGVLSEMDMGDPQNAVALARLRQDCVLAKEALSVDTETVVPVLLPGRHLDVRITRPDFEDMVRAPIESTIGALSRTLQSAQVEPAELSAVLLVGGSSRIPLVARMVLAELGRPTVVDTHPKYAVALGAATLAAEAAPAALATWSADGLAGSIPAQRSAQQSSARAVNGTPDAAAVRTPVVAAAPRVVESRTPAAVSASEDARTGPTVKMAQPQAPIPARSGGGPESAPPRPSGPSRPTSRLLGGRGWVLVAAGILAGIMVIVLAVVAGYNWAPSPAGGASPDSVVSGARPAAPAIGPEVAIPALGPTIQVGQTPGFVAVSPNGRQAYIANRNAQVVTVMDTAVNQVTATIPIEAGPPQFLVFAPDGRKLYVTIFNDQRTIHKVDVVDTASNTVIATIEQEARPFLPAVTADGKRLFIPNHDVGAVAVIDTESYKPITKIKVAPNPHWIAFSPDETRAYTANHESNVVSVIDVATLTVLTTIPVGISPHSIAVHPVQPLAAVVNYDSHTASVIDTATNKVTATIPVGRHPRDITFAPDGRFAYVVNEGSNSLSVIETKTNKVTATIPTGAAPTSVAVAPNARQAYVANVGSGTLTVVELTG